MSAVPLSIIGWQAVCDASKSRQMQWDKDNKVQRGKHPMAIAHRFSSSGIPGITAGTRSAG
jgi:hypothetical protein